MASRVVASSREVVKKYKEVREESFKEPNRRFSEFDLRRGIWNELDMVCRPVRE